MHSDDEQHLSWIFNLTYLLNKKFNPYHSYYHLNSIAMSGHDKLPDLISRLHNFDGILYLSFRLIALLFGRAWWLAPPIGTPHSLQVLVSIGCPHCVTERNKTYRGHMRTSKYIPLTLIEIMCYCYLLFNTIVSTLIVYTHSAEKVSHAYSMKKSFTRYYISFTSYILI